MSDEGRIRVGYLCSEYPALSHTFISREIAVLEREGVEIETASVNPTQGLEKMGAYDRERAARTYCIKSTPRRRIARILLGYAFSSGRFLPSLSYSIRLTARSGPRDFRKTVGYFVEAVLLHKWASGMGIGHVHVHFANPAATVALIATRLGGLSFSMSVHGPDEFYDVERNSLREKVEAATFVRCIGYYCQSQLMRITPAAQWGKFRIVRCGIWKDEFAPRPARTGSAKNILCVGRLCPSKGQAVLVEAADRLRGKGYDFSLLLLGGGEDLAYIRSMVEARGLGDRISVAGAVGHSRVREELARCDLFVLPSFAEGIPVALMEAMASGVPVVSTGITGIPELIEHGVDGMLTQPSNVEQLAGTIEAFLRGEVDTESLTSRAAEKVAAMYDVEANARGLAELFLATRG